MTSSGENGIVEQRRIGEVAFPLRQVSLDSVHEKAVRHGHLSTLHIWPARRPLAASRAAVLGTLLPDPGTRGGREAVIGRMGGTVVKEPGEGRETTVGGVFRWGREDDAGVRRFREEVREAFGGRAPRVLDPFAGGGAIPLEGMRLGCEVVASDLSPVACFLLRCALWYPRLVADGKRRLPEFALADEVFVRAFLKAKGLKGGRLEAEVKRLGRGENGGGSVESGFLRGGALEDGAGFGWHLRAWAMRVQKRVRRAVEGRYPTYAEFEPKKARAGVSGAAKAYEARARQIVGAGADGRVSADELNAEFERSYLANGANPRWVVKPTVAYLWARTVRCSDCRADVPLLKTRWLCKKERKRVRLVLEGSRGDAGGLAFGVETDVPKGEGGPAQRREHDRRAGAGTMSRTGVTCPCCGAVMTMADVRREGSMGGLGAIMTAVVVDGQSGKEYRGPTDEEVEAARVEDEMLRDVWDEIPFGLPNEPTPEAGAGAARAFSVGGYGFTTWRSLFDSRQLFTLGAFVREVRNCRDDLADYPEEWQEAIVAYLACILSKLTDYSSTICSWTVGYEKMRSTFARFALPMVWDYCEVNPLSERTGGFAAMAEWVARYLDRTAPAIAAAPAPTVRRRSAIEDQGSNNFDVICTDPPYYDAIPYSDLMDFFHVWLRRALHGLSPEIDEVFSEPLGPKWDAETNDGELIDDASRFGGDRAASKKNYEDGMFRAFKSFYEALHEDGRLVLVFANKSPDAWETLVSALIRAGFAVTASWPIQTEMQTRQRSMASAALSSSIWIVCRKRPARAKAGWDHKVLSEMEENITQRLRDFWDAGIRGPDFVWAATGPALEAFSEHPVVKKADVPGERLTSDEFLRRVRRMVVGFVVNRLLKREGGADDELDDPTTYYLLHRNDFGLESAPAGACILYALSCDVPDSALTGRLDLLAKGGRGATGETEGDEAVAPATGGTVRIKPWHGRKRPNFGEVGADGRMPPLIDCVHRVMQLWKTGERSKVDAYLDRRGLWRHELFARIVQAVIELAKEGSGERAILESIQNHVLHARSRSSVREQPVARQGALW